VPPLPFPLTLVPPLPSSLTLVPPLPSTPTLVPPLRSPSTLVPPLPSPSTVVPPLSSPSTLVPPLSSPNIVSLASPSNVLPVESPLNIFLDLFYFCISLLFGLIAASLRKLFGRSKKEEVTQAADEQVNKTEDVIEDGVNKTSQFYRQTEEDVKDVAKGAGELFF
jgi:hypothetical protein